MTRTWRRRFGEGGPRLTYGEDAILHLPELVKLDGWGRVLIVCGRTSFEASGAARVLPDLEAFADVQRWSDFDPNTDSADLARGLSVARDVAPDVIVGIGGGSAMDMAKLLCAFETTDAGGLLNEIRSGRQVEERRQALVLIPTTSGSGSEATHFAVVYIGDEKFSVAGSAMKADVVILDPILAMSASSYQRATSGIDAVCQAIESLWAVGATPRSRRFARHALRFLMPSIESFVHEPTSDSARLMSIGSHLAGQAIDISKTTAAHALSYSITKLCGISHGHAVALTLGPLIEVHADADPTRLQRSISVSQFGEVMSCVMSYLGAQDGRGALEKFAALMDRIGLDRSPRTTGLGSAKIRERITLSVNHQRLGNNPVSLSREDLRLVLRMSAGHSLS